MKNEKRLCTWPTIERLCSWQFKRKYKNSYRKICKALSIGFDKMGNFVFDKNFCNQKNCPRWKGMSKPT